MKEALKRHAAAAAKDESFEAVLRTALRLIRITPSAAATTPTPAWLVEWMAARDAAKAQQEAPAAVDKAKQAETNTRRHLSGLTAPKPTPAARIAALLRRK